MENKPIKYPDDTGKIDGWRKEDRDGHSGKFRKWQNALQAHITYVYVRISRSDESVDELLWRKRERDKEGRGLTDILYRIKMIEVLKIMDHCVVEAKFHTGKNLTQYATAYPISPAFEFGELYEQNIIER